MPVPLGQHGPLFLLQEETLHHRVNARRSSGNDARAASRRNGQQIGIAHALLRHFSSSGAASVPTGSHAFQSKPPFASRSPRNRHSVPFRGPGAYWPEWRQKLICSNSSVGKCQCLLSQRMPRNASAWWGSRLTPVGRCCGNAGFRYLRIGHGVKVQVNHVVERTHHSGLFCPPFRLCSPTAGGLGKNDKLARLHTT